jgi:ABC-type bacteriocin/lantibiotic exporter with double-glycine peptidase domain
VFVARALLSRAPLIVLDESLGALDPDTLMQVTKCIERRAIAAIVIAHP